MVLAEDGAHRIRDLAERRPVADRVDYHRHQVSIAARGRLDFRESLVCGLLVALGGNRRIQSGARQINLSAQLQTDHCTGRPALSHSRPNRVCGDER